MCARDVGRLCLAHAGMGEKGEQGLQKSGYLTACVTREGPQSLRTNFSCRSRCVLAPTEFIMISFMNEADIAQCTITFDVLFKNR